MEIDKKRSESIATLFGNEWLSHYPRPRRIVHDNGGDFVGYNFQELLDNYGILSVLTTVKPQETSILSKKLHLSMGGMLRISQPFIGECWIDEQKRALKVIAWAIRSTINSTTNHTLGQLAFSRDMIMQAKVLVDWGKL